MKFGRSLPFEIAQDLPEEKLHESTVYPPTVA